MYYERVQGNDIYNVAPNPPFSSTATVYNTSLSNPGGGAGRDSAPDASNVRVCIPDVASAAVQLRHSASLCQKCRGRRFIRRNKGNSSIRFTQYQSAVPGGCCGGSGGTANVNQVRPYLDYAAIDEYFNEGNSNYNSLQASLRTASFHGLTLQASYAYSHAIDYVSGDVPGNAHQNAYDTSLERANSDYDRRQMLILSYVYSIPVPYPQKFLRAFLGNWQLSGISIFEKGTPLNITLSGDNAGIGAPLAGRILSAIQPSAAELNTSGSIQPLSRSPRSELLETRAGTL